MTEPNPELSSYEKLLPEFMPVIRAIVADYPAIYREDLIQEGLMGLFSALRSYRAEEERPFAPYAKACIRNAIISATRKWKNEPPSESLDEDLPSGESLEETVINRHATEEFFLRLKQELSPLESRILSAYLRDWSYARISAELDVPVKTIDNSLSRIKAKIRKLSV